MKIIYVIAIIGGGIAGISLAKRLFENGLDFRLYADGQNSASHISSGIMNPITGRRYALAWDYNKFRDAAIPFYGEFLNKISIRRFYKPYSESSSAFEDLMGKEEWATSSDPEWVDIHDSYQLRVADFITFWIDVLKKENKLIAENFDYKDLICENSSFTYEQYQFDKLIFAEGIGLNSNPFFNDLPFHPNRGEALNIEVLGMDSSRIIQKGKFICPFEGNFWVGSSFERVSLSEPLLTEKQRNEILSYIPELIDNRAYKVLKHLGAFRVTIPDRRPLIGEHKQFQNMYLFNGFGTKGISHIPYFSQQLIQAMFDRVELNGEVSISRFVKSI